MSTEPFIGEVKLLAFSFPPKGYTLCQGQTLSIAQYTALFSLIGTTYGGNGQTTFNLPDLRGRVPVGQGQGPGLTPRSIGQPYGNDTVTILPANLPPHVHDAGTLRTTVLTSTAPADDNSANGTFLTSTGSDFYTSGSTPGTAYGGTTTTGTTGSVGSGVPFNNDQPSLVMNYSIALMGIFPSRN